MIFIYSYSYLEIGRNHRQIDESKEILTKQTNLGLKWSKFHKKGNFNVLTACQIS